MAHIKITEAFPLNSEAFKAATALLKLAQLKETQRVITGNTEMGITVVVTYEGGDDHYRLFCKSKFVELNSSFATLDGEKKMYLSLECLQGFQCKNFSEFKKHLVEIRRGETIIQNGKLDYD